MIVREKKTNKIGPHCGVFLVWRQNGARVCAVPYTAVYKERLGSRDLCAVYFGVLIEDTVVLFTNDLVTLAGGFQQAGPIEYR